MWEMGRPMSLKITTFDRAKRVTVSHNSNARILHRFWDISLARYRSKIADFNPPHLHLAPQLKCDSFKSRPPTFQILCLCPSLTLTFDLSIDYRSMVIA